MNSNARLVFPSLDSLSPLAKPHACQWTTSVLPKEVKERHIVQPNLRDLHHGPSTRVLRKLVIVVGEGERPARGDTMARLGNIWFFHVLFFFLSLFSLFSSSASPRFFSLPSS